MFIFIMNSCSQFIIQYFEVQEFHYDNEKISIGFTSEIDSDKMKKAFSLLENNTKTKGTFIIDGKDLHYYPDGGIKDNSDYVLSINTIAEDVDGKSLKEKFYKSFTTKISLEKPLVLETFPANGCNIDFDFRKFEIKFSKPIKEESFQSSFSIEPEVKYIASFNEMKTSVQVYFSEELKNNMEYFFKINENLQDAFGNNLEKPHVVRVFNHKDETIPQCKLYCKDLEKGFRQLYESPSENHNIPNEAEILIDFDEMIKVDYAGSKIEVYPSTIKYSYEIDKIKKNNITVKIKGEYGKKCTLTICKGIEDLGGNKIEQDLKCELHFDEEGCKPVAFKNAYLQIDGNDNYKELCYETQFSSLNLDPLYFANDRTAKEAILIMVFNVSENSMGLDFFNSIDSLSFKTTNSCCTINIIKAETISYDSLIPEIVNENEKDNVTHAVLKYTLSITNTNRNGIVEMMIDDTVKDSLGNNLDHEYSLVFNK